MRGSSLIDKIVVCVSVCVCVCVCVFYTSHLLCFHREILGEQGSSSTNNTPTKITAHYISNYITNTVPYQSIYITNAVPYQSIYVHNKYRTLPINNYCIIVPIDIVLYYCTNQYCTILLTHNLLYQFILYYNTINNFYCTNQ